MKKIYGQIFKELRLNKGYSIKEISDSEVSSATISKFEHGSAMISVDKFFRILSNINVAPSEFSLYVEERLDIPYSFTSVTNGYALFQDREKNIVKIQKTMHTLEKQLSEHPDRKFLRIQIINLKSVISQVIPQYKGSITAREIQTVKQHLLGTRNWNEFELRVFCSTIHLFDLATIEKLTYKLLSPLSYRLTTPDIKWMISIALVNLIDASFQDTTTLDTDQINFINEIIQYLNEHAVSDKYTSENGFIKFNIGIFKFITGEKEIGVQEMKEVICSFTLLNCPNYAESLIHKYEQITGLEYLKLL